MIATSAKFILGFDLGTTNSVLAYAPLDADEPKVELLTLQQLVAPGTIESRTMLQMYASNLARSVNRIRTIVVSAKAMVKPAA